MNWGGPEPGLACLEEGRDNLKVCLQGYPGPGWCNKNQIGLKINILYWRKAISIGMKSRELPEHPMPALEDALCQLNLLNLQARMFTA